MSTKPTRELSNAELKSVFGGSADDLAYARETVQMNSAANARMLSLQQEVQADSRKYTAISNIMKAKHDTQKNAIGNMR